VSPSSRPQVVQHVSYSSISPACFSMMAAPCEWDEACARARAPRPWNPLPGSTKAPAVTKCPEPSRAGLCGCSSGTALSARPAGWMDDGTPAVVKARLPVAAVHGAGRLDYENAGRRRCCRAIARLARRSVRVYCCTGVCKRTNASQRSIERRAARTGEPLSVRAGDRADCCHGTTTPYGCT